MTTTAIGVQPAIAIHPGQANSLHLTEIPRDEPGPGEVLIRVRQVGICGTDRELIHGSFGSAPAGATSLVLGHEMLGNVEAVGRRFWTSPPASSSPPRSAARMAARPAWQVNPTCASGSTTRSGASSGCTDS